MGYHKAVQIIDYLISCHKNVCRFSEFRELDVIDVPIRLHKRHEQEDFSELMYSVEIWSWNTSRTTIVRETNQSWVLIRGERESPDVRNKDYYLCDNVIRSYLIT